MRGLTAGQRDAVDAVLTASRALVAVSARSIATAGGGHAPAVPHAGGACRRPDQPHHPWPRISTSRPPPRCGWSIGLSPRGLVERTVRPDNRRETHLSLTVAGRRTVRTVTARRRRDISTVIDTMEAEQRVGLADAMAAFADAADRLWPGIATTV